MFRRSIAVGFALAVIAALGIAALRRLKCQLLSKAAWRAACSRTPIIPPVVFDVFEITGNSTHLGKFELVIEAMVDFGNQPPTGEGTLTFIAANGDKLVADNTGFSKLVARVWC